MRILQFCPKPPLPAVDGGCLASYRLSQNLISCGYDLKVVCLATQKHAFLRNSIDTEYKSQTNIEAIEINTNENIFKIFLSFLKKSSIQKSRFYKSKVQLWLQNHLKTNQYDIIILDGLMSGLYLDDIRENSNSKIIYRAHNIEFQLLIQKSKYVKSSLTSWIYKRESEFLKIQEIDVIRKSNQTWTISELDQEFLNKNLNSQKNIFYIPFSLDENSSANKSENNSFFHLGAMDWQPNVDGLIWFINEVWSKILKVNSQIQFHIGGKDIESVSQKLEGQNIVMHKEVINADEFYDKYEILVIPVLVAGGIRIKIIQALSKGKIIVSTKIGVAGIPAVHKKHLMIANNANEMIAQLDELLQDEELKNSLKQGALNLFKENFNKNVVDMKIKNVINELF